MTHTRLAGGGGREFDLIRRMQARWGDLAIGIGDDAALLEVPRGEQLAASTDAAIEDVHFGRSWVGLDDIGYRAVTAALSDLAAMAAQPLGVLVSLQLDESAEAGIEALADGIGAAVGAARTVIRGGNVASSRRLAITTTVFGAAFAPLSRAAARPGDLLYVTGSLGGPAAAVRAFKGGSSPGQAARARFVRPVARIAEARWLAHRGAVAAIDISDGLAGDAAHLAAASGVSVAIELERVPLVGGAEPDDVFGGEEYEILVAARSELPATGFERAFGIPLTMIGEIAQGAAEVRLSRAGRRVASPGGYEHFSR